MSTLLNRLTEKTQAAREKIAKDKESQDNLKKIQHEAKIKEAVHNALEMIPKIEKNLLDMAGRGNNSMSVTLVKWSPNSNVNIYEETYRQEIMNYLSNEGLQVEIKTATNPPNSHLPSSPNITYDHNIVISW